jgi:hypothetical protein
MSDRVIQGSTTQVQVQGVQQQTSGDVLQWQSLGIHASGTPDTSGDHVAMPEHEADATHLSCTTPCEVTDAACCTPVYEWGRSVRESVQDIPALHMVCVIYTASLTFLAVRTLFSSRCQHVSWYSLPKRKLPGSSLVTRRRQAQQ